MATSAGPALRKLGDLHGNKAEEEGALAILGLAASSVVEVGATTRGLLPADDGGMPGARAAARTTHVEARCGTTRAYFGAASTQIGLPQNGHPSNTHCRTLLAIGNVFQVSRLALLGMAEQQGHMVNARKSYQ